MQKCMCSEDMTHYYRAQLKICMDSELYGSYRYEHGGKVLMLFSEIFSFLSTRYGIDTATTFILQFQNNPSFKTWFWSTKYELGKLLIDDPTFTDIGTWIGRGFFLKITYSIVNNMALDIEKKFIHDLITKQSAIIELLLKKSKTTTNACGIPGITKNNNGYMLLGQKTILNESSGIFHHFNKII